jgi:hypothetical protein
MANPRKRQTGYTIVSVRRGNGLVSIAQFRCIACGETTDVTLGGSAANPQVIANIAKLRGWQTDAYRVNRIYCPACLGEPVPDENPIQEVLMSDSPKRPELREPTPDERVRIRELLDRYFDDELGAYANDYSDERIGLEAGDVPWAIVTRIREAGWGPIRQTPQIVEVRRDLDMLRKEYEKMEAETRDLAAVMQKEISESRDKVTSGMRSLRLCAAATSRATNVGTIVPPRANKNLNDAEQSYTHRYMTDLVSAIIV